jgi:hypothetical protein
MMASFGTLNIFQPVVFEPDGSLHNHTIFSVAPEKQRRLLHKFHIFPITHSVSPTLTAYHQRATGFEVHNGVPIIGRCVPFHKSYFLFMAWMHTLVAVTPSQRPFLVVTAGLLHVA